MKIPQITLSIISYGSSYRSLERHKFSPAARSTKRADIEFVKREEDLLSSKLRSLPKSRARGLSKVHVTERWSRETSGRDSDDA